jgi:hypothetical protein
MKKYILSSALLIALTLSSGYIMAQPGFDDDVQDTPIDGGVSLLLAAGLAYGLARKAGKK